mmetsp:Transcript_51149/g.158459  ORF Transcript_51149/g.158459 Transcript_51149/m.158459 type:complete len:245 (+) Transcript_51149:98-832(+)
MSLRGSCLLVGVLLCLTLSALAERHSGSVMLEGAQLLQDFLGTHEASRGRGEFAGLAKAGAVAILAALLGGAGYVETTRGRGADACRRGASDDAAEQGEDPTQSEYADYMDGMYEDAFDGLRACDLVSGGPAAEAANLPRKTPSAEAELAYVAPPEQGQAEAGDCCPVAGDLEELLAPCHEGAEAEVELEAPQGQEDEDYLEAALARECGEVAGGDDDGYAELMEHEYQGLRSRMEASGALRDT